MMGTLVRPLVQVAFISSFLVALGCGGEEPSVGGGGADSGTDAGTDAGTDTDNAADSGTPSCDPAANEAAPIPELEQWEANMLLRGREYAESFLSDWETIRPNLSANTGPTYYDGQRVFQNIADYVGEAAPVHGAGSAYGADASGNVIAFQDDVDLSSVEADGSWRIWLGWEDGESNALSVITAVDQAAGTVTIEDAVQIEADAAADFAIMGYWMSAAWANGEVFRQGTEDNPGVTPRGGSVDGWWNFTHGLAEQYLRAGEVLHREAVVLLSQHAAYARDEQNPQSIGFNRPRETAYALVAYINAERVGEPRRTGGRLEEYASRPELYANRLLEGLDRWFIEEEDDRYKPFYFGLTAEALILYWDHVEQDPRIVEKLKMGADWTWENGWHEANESFYYQVGSSTQGAPDLSLLVAPLYSWLYLQTGDPIYRDRGDEAFAGGVRGAWLGDAKQFNQNYRWSFDYVRWRNEAEQVCLVD